MADLNGTWSYRSFRSGESDNPPQIAVPWAPVGVLVAESDSTGTVAGTLKFNILPLLEVTVNGSITPAGGHLLSKHPEGIKLTAKGGSAVYDLQGYFIDDDHIVGTVVGVQHDLAQQPDGTNGPFALFKTGP